MADDWFRSPAWDEPTRADFEARLARSRPHNRQQYLRINGVSLRYAGNVAAARELLQRAADYPEPDNALHQTIAAGESLADMAAERGDRSTAEELYRRILALPNQSGSTGTIEISLADLLLDSGRPEDRDKALDLLDTWMARDQLKFDHVLFRWHRILIRIAEAIGDRGDRPPRRQHCTHACRPRSNSCPATPTSASSEPTRPRSSGSASSRSSYLAAES